MVASLTIMAALTASVSGMAVLEEPRIVNGVPTTATEYPFIVDVRMDWYPLIQMQLQFLDLFGNMTWNMSNWTSSDPSSNGNGNGRTSFNVTSNSTEEGLHEGSMLCAIGNDTDSCQGDSGGPLMKKGTTVQVGVTSWGIGCNAGLPGVYADVSNFTDWIQAQIDNVSAAMDPTAEPTPIPTLVPTDIPTMIPTVDPTVSSRRRLLNTNTTWNSTNMTWNFDFDIDSIIANWTAQIGCSLEVNATTNATTCWSESQCTGSLIQLEWPATILTAAHCISFPLPSMYGVYLGRTDADGNFSSSNNYSFHSVWKLSVHPDYNAEQDLRNDIALFFLDEDLSDDNRLDVVTLNEDALSYHEELRVIGYGLNQTNGSVTDTLEYADQWFINDSFCEYWFESYFGWNATWNSTSDSDDSGDTDLDEGGDGVASYQVVMGMVVGMVAVLVK